MEVRTDVDEAPRNTGDYDTWHIGNESRVSSFILLYKKIF